MSTVDEVARVCGEALAVAAHLGEEVAALLLGGADRAEVTDAVTRIATQELTARELVFGAGFVGEPGRFSGPLMAWWQALGAERTVTLLDPGATGGGYVRSYEDIEWYRVPRETLEAHMTGPYVDLLCTDEATLTFTAPVPIDGAFAGVVGADITVPVFERALSAVLRVGQIVVTNERRVAASADPTVVVGRRLPTLDGFELTAVPGTQFSVGSPR
ncbi:MAG: cache domain-containing protein [Microbacterium sp.]